MIKDLQKISVDLKNFNKKTLKNIAQAQEKTAESIYEHLMLNSNMDSGKFLASIDIDETKVIKKNIQTFIGSNLQVKTKSGKSYNLGFLLETGTDPHAIPNAFNWGEIYGYDSEQYARTTKDNWHPGTTAYNNYKKALDSNVKLYKENIAEAIKISKEN